MADQPDIHTHEQGGIFIPYDKLLERIEQKQDDILKEVRELGRQKLDQTVFDSFRTTYEERHERLKSRQDSVERELIGRHELISEFRESQGDIEALKKYKAEREAVQEQFRWYVGGGALVGLLVVINLIINSYQIVTGGTP